MSDDTSCPESDEELECENTNMNDMDEDDEMIFTPYVFTLKDVFNNPITLQKYLSENSKIVCPPFHVLLDHTIAILWIVFSDENTDVLQTSHVHWALKFLEGLKDKLNRQTEDVKTAINHLQEILVDMISNVDLCELEKRDTDRFSTNYCDFEGYLNTSDNDSNIDINNKNSTCVKKKKNSSLEDDLSNNIISGKKKCNCKDNCKCNNKSQHNRSELLSVSEDIPPRLLSDKCNTKLYEHKDYPSFILEDILGRKNPNKLKDFVNISKHNSTEKTIDDKDESTKLETSECSNSNECEARISKSCTLNEDLKNWKGKQYDKIIRQIQQLSQLDETFKNIKCTESADIIEKLDHFFNQPDTNC